MNLCTVCSKLDIKDFTNWDNDIEDVPHVGSLWTLKVSSKSCVLCGLLFTELQKHPSFKEPQADNKSSPIFLRGAQYVDKDYEQGGIYLIRGRCDSEKIKAWIGLYPDEENSVFIPETVVVGRQVRPPEQQFGLMQEWISNCRQTHSHCEPPPGKLPTRVIDVGVMRERKPFLKVTNGSEIAHYITLSHCWGIKPIIRTTKSTLESHLTQLPLENLPNTFRDAIIITRELGIQYLWIDSLCIVQDDAEDWERQSAVMGSIYSSSYLTIAASASRDSSGGCFLPRPRENHARIKCTLEDGTISHVFLRPKAKDFSDLEKSFLQTRAWVGQERFLSPRSIHFDVDQILWECQEERLVEDGVPVSDSASESLIAAWDGRFKLEYPYPVGRIRRDFVWDWYEMIENYTTRNLTNPDDKLPALSGIAHIMAPRVKDRYVAGLWESHINIGLLWRRAGASAYLTRPPNYRAPSWSWASLDGQTLMVWDQFSEHMINRYTPIAKDIVVDIQPLGLDPYGRIAFGSITLTTTIKRIPVRIDPKSESYTPYPEQGSGEDHIWDYSGESVGTVNYDEEYPAGARTKELWALQMSYLEHPKKVLCHCLILEYTGVGNDYRRIGRGLTGLGEVREGWFEGAEVKRIRII